MDVPTGSTLSKTRNSTHAAAAKQAHLRGLSAAIDTFDVMNSSRAQS